MQKLITILISIIILIAGVFAVNHFFPKITAPIITKIPFLGKEEKQVTTAKASEFMQIDGETFNPKTSSIVQMLIARKTASFDGRQWHKETVATKEDFNGVRIMPEGNNQSNWSEAIDFTQFSKFNNVTDFAKAHKTEILKKYPNAVWRTIKQDSSGIVYDWTVVGDAKLGDYTEVGKIMTNDAGVFHVLYVNKHSPNVAKTRATFLNFVDNL